MSDPAPEITVPLSTNHYLGEPNFVPWANKVDYLLNQELARSTGVVSLADAKYGAALNGTTDDAAAVAAAVADCPVGGTLVLPAGKSVRLATPVTVAKSMHVTGRGATVVAATGEAFIFTASNSSLSDATFTGPGTTYVANKKLVVFRGTSAAPLSNVRVARVKASGLPANGIWLEWVKGFDVSECDISNYAYSGIMVLSGVGGVITRNRVGGAVQDATAGLSYGIAVSDSTGNAADRSKNVMVSYNYVYDVPLWEGLDTHSGLNVSFIGNVVVGCLHAIAITVGADTRATPPQHILVEGNICDGTGLASSAGVWVGGSSPNNPNDPLYASAVIKNNDLTRNTTPLMIQSDYDKFDAANCDISNNLGASDKLFPYTPTWTASTTNPTLANGTLTGLWRKSGGDVIFEISLTIGSTTNVGNGPYAFTLPVTPSSARIEFGPGTARDASTTTTFLLFGESLGTTALVLRAMPATAGLALVNASQTIPFTNAAGDVYTISGRYRAA